MPRQIKPIKYFFIGAVVIGILLTGNVYTWRQLALKNSEAENNFHKTTNVYYLYLGAFAQAKEGGEDPSGILSRSIELLHQSLLAQLKESVELYPQSDTTKNIATGLAYMDEYYKWGKRPDWLVDYVKGIESFAPGSLHTNN